MPRCHFQTGKCLVDEMASHGVSWVLVRGGEPFLVPGIIELLE
jgi:organic radical activating enzyme